MHTSVIYFTHSGVRSCVEIKYQVSLSARELPFLVICQQNSWLCPQKINYTCDTLYYKPQLLASKYTTGFLQVCHLDTSTQHCCKVTAIQEVMLTTNWHLSWRNSLQYWKKNHQLSLDNEMYLVFYGLALIFCSFHSAREDRAPCFVLENASDIMETRSWG